MSDFRHVLVPGLNIELQATMTPAGRLYTTPEGNVYPSASTITKILTRDAIEKWRTRVGVEEADRKTKRGANRGTNLHLVCEKYLLNTLTPMDRLGMFPTTKELFLNTKQNLDKHVDIVYAVEQALYSDKLRIAGRTDAIVSWDCEPAVVDFKTSGKHKPKEWITNYFVQCSAYAVMFEERTGIPIKKIVILMSVDEDSSCVVYVEDKTPYLPILHKCIDTYNRENS